jgi:hypothetical protein
MVTFLLALKVVGSGSSRLSLRNQLEAGVVVGGVKTGFRGRGPLTPAHDAPGAAVA